MQTIGISQIQPTLDFSDYIGWVTILLPKKTSYILCIGYKISQLSFCALAGRVGCQFSVLGPQMVYFWRFGGSKNKMPVKTSVLYIISSILSQRNFFIISKSFFASWRPSGSDYILSETRGALLSPDFIHPIHHIVLVFWASRACLKSFVAAPSSGVNFGLFIGMQPASQPL